MTNKHQLFYIHKSNFLIRINRLLLKQLNLPLFPTFAPCRRSHSATFGKMHIFKKPRFLVKLR